MIGAFLLPGEITAFSAAKPETKACMHLFILKALAKMISLFFKQRKLKIYFTFDAF
jgi:hypothetical protein